jgi:hypothetical protein
MSKFAPWLVVLVLMVASAWTVMHAVSDETAISVNGRLYDLTRERVSLGVAPSSEAVAALESDLKLAIKLAPANGLHREAMMRLHQMPIRTAASVDVVNHDLALKAAGESVVRLPSSGYAWASLAAMADTINTQGKLTEGLPLIERALGNAFRYGGQERQVLASVLDVGFANTPQLSSEARRILTAATHNLSLRYPDNVIALAVNRGTVEAVCKGGRLVKHKVCVDLREAQAAQAQTANS